MGKQPADYEKKPENWIYALSVQKEETNTDNTFSLADLPAGSLCVTAIVLPLQIFTAAVAALHIPYYMSHYISNTFFLLTLLSTQPEHWLS